MKTRFAGSVVVISVMFAMFAFVHPLSAAVPAATATADGKVSPPPTTTTKVSTTGIAEGRGHFPKMTMNPYMMIPQLIALGFAPIVLANLKMMVMSALMMNNMALNAAIFMTIRNMVFGPRPKVKYVNYGYRDHPHHHHHYGGDSSHHQHHAGNGHLRQQHQDEQLLQTSVDGIETYERRKRTSS